MPLNHPHCFGLSDVGRERTNNEDQLLIADLSKSMTVHHSTLPMADETRLFSDVEGQLLLVADGMGGHSAGERASELATATIVAHVLHTMPWFLRLRHENEDYFHEVLEDAVMQCARVIDLEASAISAERDMGTTLTLAYIIWPRMFVVHVGDSRCYLWRNGKLDPVTRDHTFLSELEKLGHDVDESERSRFGSILVNSIGRGLDRVHPEVYQIDLELDDVVLLCSDGLSDMISDDEIAMILHRNCGDEKSTCEALVAAANEAGGRDNITVVVSRYATEVDLDFSANGATDSEDLADTVLDE